MYLVDTSVWIDYLRERTNPATQYFSMLLDSNRPFGITTVIYQEILQGAASLKDFEKLEQYLKTQKFYSFQDGKDSAAKAAKLYFNCRRKGITIRSTIDCMIAQIAIENKLLLVHNDKDFTKIANVNSALQLAL